jgi:hypothetical protein
MSTQPPPGGSGPLWPAQSAGFGLDKHGWISDAQLPGRAHTRQAAALFQPVTDVQPPPAAPTDQPRASANDINEQSEPRCAPVPRPESASGVRRWAGPGGRLVGKTSGAVTTVMASAMLAVILGGITQAVISSDKSPPAEHSRDRLPTSTTPVIGDKPITVSGLDTSARFAGQTPDTVSAQPAAAPAHRQPVWATRQDKPAAAPPAPQHPQLPAPPPALLSPGTTDNAGLWMFPDSFPQTLEPPTTDTGPCHCEAVMRTIPGHRNDRSPQAGHPHDSRSAQQQQHRSMNTVK